MRFPLKLSVVAFALFVLLVSSAVPAVAMDENEMVMKIRNFQQQIEGASEATQMRYAAKLASELGGGKVVVHSAVVTGFIGESLTLGPGVFNVAINNADFQAKTRLPRLARREDGPWAIATKSYQGYTMNYFIQLQPPELADSFRIGQKVSFDGIINAAISSATQPAVMSWSKDWGVVIIGARVSLETRILKCSNGHEYAPAAGYKFCPQDGLPLK
jgi:hypothetical protein